MIKQSTTSETGNDVKIEDLDTSRSVHANLPPLIILHYSPYKQVWDWFVLLLVLYTAVLTPYSAAFFLRIGDDPQENSTTQNTTAAPEERLPYEKQAFHLFVIDLVVDFMFIVDILTNFLTTYVADGEVITDRRKIAKHYLRGWFFIDALAAVPFDMVMFGLQTSNVRHISSVYMLLYHP